jgi:amino-acid N-acetyltransferase
MVTRIIQDQTALEGLKSFLQKNALPFSDVKLEKSLYLTYFNDHKQLVASGGLELFDQYALLRSVAVEKQERGKKYGHQVVQDLLAQAKSLGVTQLYLLTETAERFFEAESFRKISKEQVPASVLDASEFKNVCPVSATCMVYQLSQ